jgi:hypothetical protein
MNEGIKHVLIPNGWTYFVHRSNTEHWNEEDLYKNIIKVKEDNLMSVEKEEDLYDYIRTYGENAYMEVPPFSYGDGIPFEIRCLIPRIEHAPFVPEDIKEQMISKFYFDNDNYVGEYGRRHPSIPAGEELAVLGRSTVDNMFNNERNIIWVLPTRFKDFYVEEIRKDNNRVINCVMKEDGEHFGTRV